MGLKQVSSTPIIFDRQTLNSPLRGVAWRREDSNTLVLTYATEDRTGLVYFVADLTARFGARIVRNQSSVVDDIALSTFFLTGEDAVLRQLEIEFSKNQEVSGDVHLVPVKEVEIHFVAEDRPGLLRDVARVFSSRGINMKQLDGLVEIELREVFDEDKKAHRTKEIQWAVFYARATLLQGHLAQMRDVEAELRRKSEFFVMRDVTAGRPIEKKRRETPTARHLSNGQQTREQFFEFLCNKAFSN